MSIENGTMAAVATGSREAALAAAGYRRGATHPQFWFWGLMFIGGTNLAFEHLMAREEQERKAVAFLRSLGYQVTPPVAAGDTSLPLTQSEIAAVLTGPTIPVRDYGC